MAARLSARGRTAVIRRLTRGIAAATLASGLMGCANTWDDMTSRDFHVRMLFTSTDPMVVLRDSTDGDARAKALLALREPRESGGTDAEQSAVLEILTRSAVNDARPLCRLAAAQTLGRFKDPKAAQILVSCYDAAATLTGESAVAVQTTALTSLGQTKQPQASAFLVSIASKKPNPDQTDRDMMVQRDLRLAAVRALTAYNGSTEIATAMARIVQEEREPALRDRARETYVKITGKEPESGATPPLPAPGINVDIQLTGGSR
jgi:hypothetical protein